MERSDLFADASLAHRPGSWRGPHRVPQARMVLPPALRSLHRLSLRDLAFRRQELGRVVVWDVGSRTPRRWRALDLASILLANLLANLLALRGTFYQDSFQLAWGRVPSVTIRRQSASPA